MRPTAWCRWAVEAGICWAEKAARWELIPRGPCCTCTQEQNNYRTENDSALHIMMAESSGQNILSYIMGSQQGFSRIMYLLGGKSWSLADPEGAMLYLDTRTNQLEV